MFCGEACHTPLAMATIAIPMAVDNFVI